MLPFWTESPTKKSRVGAEGDMARGDHDRDTDAQKPEPMEVNDSLDTDTVEDCSRRPGYHPLLFDKCL